MMLNEATLLGRCQNIEGLSFTQVASMLSIRIPAEPSQRKGWVGQAIERVLGATAGSQSKPDFLELGIELKTLPINHLNKPAESTFVTHTPLLTIHKQVWKTSQCYAKLRRVLWVPIEDDTRIPFECRRIGRAILWSPSEQEEMLLENDWSELSLMIGSGRLAEIDASMGLYLQIRPKGANSRSVCYGFNEDGEKILTMPRGFYLRTCFTEKII